MIHGQFNSHHICRLRQIAALHGFTGMALVGVALEAVDTPIEAPAVWNDKLRADDMLASQELLELQEEQEQDEQDEQLDIDILDILAVSMDHIQLNQ